jgi:hypothetical protein
MPVSEHMHRHARFNTQHNKLGAWGALEGRSPSHLPLGKSQVLRSGTKPKTAKILKPCRLKNQALQPPVALRAVVKELPLWWNTQYTESHLQLRLVVMGAEAMLARRLPPHMH